MSSSILTFLSWRGLPGEHLRLCPQDYTCCSSQMEETLALQSERDFLKAVEENSQFLLTTFTQRHRRFDGETRKPGWLLTVLNENIIWFDRGLTILLFKPQWTLIRRSLTTEWKLKGLCLQFLSGGQTYDPQKKDSGVQNHNNIYILQQSKQGSYQCFINTLRFLVHFNNKVGRATTEGAEVEIQTFKIWKGLNSRWIASHLECKAFALSSCSMPTLKKTPQMILKFVRYWCRETSLNSTQCGSVFLLQCQHRSKHQSHQVTACPTSYRFPYDHLLAHCYSSRLESLYADPICTSTHPQSARMSANNLH